MSVTGFDQLQRELQDASKALKSLDGTITTLDFDPDDRNSVQAAIRQMEDAIDQKTRRYRGNVIVAELAQGMKAEYRKAILERAPSAK